MAIPGSKPLLFLITVVLAGCATQPPAGPVPDSLPPPVEAAFESYEGLCPFGDPVLGPSWAVTNVTVISRPGYLILHNDDLKTPVWVCEQLTVADVHGPLTGRDTWCADPELCDQRHPDGRPVCNPSQCERGATDYDYRGSGWDRGHLAPNMNERLDEQQKRHTFYFSNTAPQVGRRFNQSTWQALEFDLTAHVCAVDTMWTITGTLYTDDRWDNGSASLGTIGTGVEVPTHFWKLVIWQTSDAVDGFVTVMENREYQGQESYRDFVQPIRWLEEILDVDFLPMMSRTLGDGVEARIGQPLPYRYQEDCSEFCGDDARCPTTH